MSRLSSPARLRSVAGLSVGALVLAGLAAVGPVGPVGPAQAAPGTEPGCPAAYPVGDLALGQPVTGLTTAGSHNRGGTEYASTTSPEEFTGVYRGTIEDAAGDLLVFELDGSRVTRTDGTLDAGVWAGMSGSPLYAADGRLVGAVSYSFSGLIGSRFAGVTPAADLYALLDDQPVLAPAQLSLSRTERSQLSGSGVPYAATSGGLTRLDPATVIGGVRDLHPAALDRIAQRVRRTPAAAVGGTGSQTRSVPLLPGANLAVADSYGSLPLYGVGTVAAVCDGTVIGFGHPANWAPGTRTIHGAVTTHIQDDGAYSYKMANLAAPEGTLTADRYAGVLGRPGRLPDSATVTTRTTGPRPRTSVSTVPNSDALPYVTAVQAYRDAALTLDQDAGGDALLRWTITFTRANGRTQTFTRAQRYSVTGGLGDTLTSDVASDVDAILNNEFEDVTITDVSISEGLSRDYKFLKITGLQRKVGSSWRTVQPGQPLKVAPRRYLTVRAVLRPTRWSKAAATTHLMRFWVPRGATGGGRLLLRGGAVSPDFFYDEEGPDGSTARNLDDLLRQRKTVRRQDTMTVLLSHRMRNAAPRLTAREWRAPTILGGDYATQVRVQR